MWNRGKRSFSRTRTRLPARARKVAAELPPGPPPMIIASKSSRDMRLMKRKFGERASPREQGPERPALVRTIVVVRVQRGAVVKATIGAGRANEDAAVGEINPERSSPGINEFALVIHFGFGTDDDNHVLFIFSLER